jgi:hypothetical protein
MRPALPASDYYDGSAPCPACSTDDVPSPTDRAGCADKGRDREGSRVHQSIDRRSRHPAIPPRHRHDYPAALRRGLPGQLEQTTREFPVPPAAGRVRAATSPDLPDSSWRHLRRLHAPVPLVYLFVLLAGPAPSGSADTSRLRRGRLPPSPASPGSGCPQLHRPAATGQRRRSPTSTRSIGASRRTDQRCHLSLTCTASGRAWRIASP